MKYQMATGEMVQILSDSEVSRAAWQLIVEGAESYWEDWIDEDGNFTDEDADRVYERAGDYIALLKGIDPNGRK